MIKWIKNLLSKIFGVTKEPIVSEEVKEKIEEKEEIVTPEKIKCNTHSRFKKSCPICIEAANG